MSERKHWKAEEKLALIKEVKEKGQVVETCRRYGTDSTIFYRWKEAFQTFGMEGLRSRSRSNEPGLRKLKKENEQLRNVISRNPSLKKWIELNVFSNCTENIQMKDKQRNLMITSPMKHKRS